MRRLNAVSAAILLSQAFVLVAQAISFPDVPFTHIYREQIEELADRGVIKGNPDGSFNPSKTVNRAEMLTFLYRATGKNPASPSKQCKSDVVRGAWYEAVVCDAIAKGYVSGYPDGTFKPGQDVNRVESLKMIMTVFGFGVTGASMEPLNDLRDVDVNAWYAPYIATAYRRNILPIVGQDGTLFYPNNALKRGEAAAYIFGALGLELDDTLPSSSSSSTTTRSSHSSASSTAAVAPMNVDFPFGDNGRFVKKDARAYAFSLQRSVVGTFEVNVDSENDGVTCRLYKLSPETSFAIEYYIGHRLENHCVIRAALGAGDYQFEVSPTEDNLLFDVFVNDTEGDGNDGFREAEKLLVGRPKVSFLDVEDHADWFWFNLSTDKRNMMVKLTNADNVRCIIYPMADVDIYGFAGPECNKAYDFPEGTYYIGIQHRDERLSQQSFTLQYE